MPDGILFYIDRENPGLRDARNLKIMRFHPGSMPEAFDQMLAISEHYRHFDKVMFCDICSFPPNFC